MKQENEFVLPEAWSIKVTDGNLDVIQEFKSKTPHNDHASQWRYCEYNGIGSNDLSFPEITFDQFREHVLKDISKPEYDPKDVAFKIVPVSELEIIPTPDNLKMYEPKPITVDDFKSVYAESEFNSERKILGYKLIKPEYKEAVDSIIGFTYTVENYIFAYNDRYDSEYIHKLKEAGVMHWFEEVYEKEVIRLKSGVKLSEDDIAEVKEILKNK